MSPQPPDPFDVQEIIAEEMPPHTKITFSSPAAFRYAFTVTRSGVQVSADITEHLLMRDDRARVHLRHIAREMRKEWEKRVAQLAATDELVHPADDRFIEALASVIAVGDHEDTPDLWNRITEDARQRWRARVSRDVARAVYHLQAGR